jgi:hypothetical protein
MADHEPSFDPAKEEHRLNLIFSQIDDEYEGRRNAAASRIRDWMENHRAMNHGLRLVLSGTSAERTLRKIHDLESRNEALAEEIRLLRSQVAKTDLRNLERRRKARANSHWEDLVDAITNHLYGGQVAEIPRGAIKVIAGILGCSKTTVGDMLRRMRPVTLTEVEKIRAAKPVSPPNPPAKKRRGESGKTTRKSEMERDFNGEELGGPRS